MLGGKYRYFIASWIKYADDFILRPDFFYPSVSTKPHGIKFAICCQSPDIQGRIAKKILK